MKTFLIFLALGFLAILSGESMAASHGGSVYVRGHTTKAGTYVAPHYRSAPDHSVANNWSTKGNVNPYTGQPGTKNVGTVGGGYYGGSTTSPNSRVGDVDVLYPQTPAPETVRPEVRPTIAPPPAAQRSQISSEPTGKSDNVTLKMSIQTDDPILAYQKKAAADGFPEAQYVMGMRYLTGNGVPKNETQGKGLIQEAAKHACERAMEKMQEFREADRLAKARNEQVSK